MKRILTLLLLAAPLSLAIADDAKPQPPTPPAKEEAKEVRLVPAVRNGKPEGLKMYAIKAGGRLAKAGFKNGDTLTHIDGTFVPDALSEPAVREVIVEGSRGGKCDLIRQGTKKLTITLEKK